MGAQRATEDIELGGHPARRKTARKEPTAAEIAGALSGAGEERRPRRRRKNDKRVEADRHGDR